MACNLSQYCAGNIAEAKTFYRDICHGNIFTELLAWELLAWVNTGTIAPAKSKILCEIKLLEQSLLLSPLLYLLIHVISPFTSHTCHSMLSKAEVYFY